MALVQTVHLSMANFKSAPVVPAVQNDSDRQVKMIIDDYTLTSGLTGKIAFERSDGTHYETAAELVLTDNAFVADIDQALTQPGRTMVQLKVTDTLTVSTFSFVIFVEADNSGTVTPQEGIDLVTAVEAAEDAADRAESAAETLELDATLTSPTKAAQAKAVGDEIGEVKSNVDQVIERYKVTSVSTGGVNVAYPMSIGDSIIVTNNTSASVVVRQRDSGGTVLVATDVISGTTTKIVSTVNSTDIRFYFNVGGTIYFENGDKRLPVLEEKVEEIPENESVNNFMVDYLFDSKLIFHDAAYNNNGSLNTDVVVAEFNIDANYRTFYIKANSITNVTNNYPIGIKEYDSNNTLLATTGRNQEWLLRGTKIHVSNANTTKVKIYINIGTNTANSIKDLFVWATRSERVDRKPFPVFHVEKDGSGDFDSLVNAINEAVQYMDAIVYVGKGVWDIISELGSDYLANVSDTQRGLYLKNRIHVICDSRSKIVANYTGGLDNVKTWLAIFNAGEYGFTLENATLEGSNIRYLIHDERDQGTDAYTNKYINCTMVFDNRNNTAWSAKQCIGGGLGQNGYIDIEGCTFKSYQGYDGTVSYHNTGASSGRSHIVVRDCYFYLYNTFRLSWYGTSAEITDAVVTNCYLGADIVHRAENASATVENTAIVSWNNTINPHT